VDDVFATMREASWHTYQILTKRPERMAKYAAGCAAALVDAPHIWLGTSVESQEYLSRAELVARLPSAVRFLSCEPLIGPLDLGGVLGGSAVNWVIVGGESGARARPMDPSWVEEIRRRCTAARVPFFFKQWGGVRKKVAGRSLGGRTWDEMPALVGG
jgi:protein gp37